MLKAVIVTIHSVINFGSVLQTYASERILRRENLEVNILNYIPRRVTYRQFLKRQLAKPWRIPLIPLSLSVFIINKHIYNGFLKKYCHLTKPYYSLDEIRKDIPQAEFYITGSDQVWNSTHNGGLDEIYYYTFLPSECRVFSLSSSFGKESLPIEESEKVRIFLSRYNYISVREQSAKILLESLGFRNVEHLLDPTMLLERQEWYKLIDCRIIKEPYLIVFIPYNTISKEIIYGSARKIAQSKGLKIVTFSWNIIPERLADKTIFFAKPECFLSLMYYADCIITNSFHGTAFAINFNRQLWVYEPSSFSTRLIDLLELTGLKHRLLSDVIEDEMIEEPMEYVPVNEILALERKKAMLYIEKALNKNVS